MPVMVPVIAAVIRMPVMAPVIVAVIRMPVMATVPIVATVPIIPSIIIGLFGGGFGGWCRQGPHSWRPGKQTRRRCRVPGTGEDTAIGAQGRNGRYSQKLHFSLLRVDDRSIGKSGTRPWPQIMTMTF